ncbi:MAG: dihydrolipoyl dehydrogenase [Dongiaceae bacterium]
MDNNFDLIIIGGGPGGYVAAIRAAQLKMKVALVEREHLGGICLNWGCIPTKALLRTAEVHHLIKHADAFGIEVAAPKLNWAKVISRSRDVSKKLSAGIAHLMKKNKITVFDGHAKLAGKGKVSVTKDNKPVAELTAKHIIVATGARPRVLPGLEPDGKLVWTSREAMIAPELPKSLLVIGSGAIGIEFASFYRHMGSEVTVVEVIDRILPVEDEEISTFARKAFEKQGIKIITGGAVKKLDKSANNVKATIEVGGKAQEIVFDRVISAVGIVGNTENLGLESTKVKVEKGHIVTNEWCETAEAGVYAIGDVTAPPWLAHKASHEGVICVEKIAKVNDVHPLKRELIPGCTYSLPQIASIGLTEKRAKELGMDIKIGRFPYMGNGKAIALGEAEGLIKTIFDAKTGEMLGAHMIGAEVTELIQGFGIAKTLEATEADLMHTVFPHPTLSEMMHESVLDAYGKVIHY